MKKFLLSAVLLFSVVSFAYAGSDIQAVKAANAGFYSALNAVFAGNLTPMTAVWSHASDVTYMGPDGTTEVGWKAVLADWKKQTALTLGGKVMPSNLHIVIGKDIAVVQDLETGVNKLTHGKPQTVSIRATNIYRLENGQWKMISHHTDTLSYLLKKKS